MKTLCMAVCVMLAAIPAPRTLEQRTYAVNVAVEQATHDDFKALSDWITAAPPDAEVPDSLLQPGTAAMAEIAAAVEERVEATRLLTLDDGSRVELIAGDIVRATPRVAGRVPTEPAIPPVVIQKGQGVATTLGRKDIVVPSGL